MEAVRFHVAASPRTRHCRLADAPGLPERELDVRARLAKAVDSCIVPGSSLTKENTDPRLVGRGRGLFDLLAMALRRSIITHDTQRQMKKAKRFFLTFLLK